MSPTVPPTLVSEVKATVQQVAVQVFYSTLGEPHTPSNQNSEPVQTGVLHAPPGQVGVILVQQLTKMPNNIKAKILGNHPVTFCGFLLSSCTQ